MVYRMVQVCVYTGTDFVNELVPGLTRVECGTLGADDRREDSPSLDDGLVYLGELVSPCCTSRE